MNYSNLRCPDCKNHLTKVKEELLCSKCNISYPIKKGIPIFLKTSQSIDLDKEQNTAIEKKFYEDMFSNLKGLDDGHCIVYGYERIYDFIDGIEKGSVIEAGCGGGHHSVNLSKRGFNVTSIDLSLNGLFAARKLAEHEGQDIQYLCGDIKRLPFEDNAFDICFCSLILHHFTSMDNVVKELSRVTKKYFVAFEVNALEPISFVRFNVLNPFIGIKNISKNQRAVFPKRLENVLATNGFKNTVISYEDVHEYLGKAPKSIKAKLIVSLQKSISFFPEKYRKNKFLLLAEKQ